MGLRLSFHRISFSVNWEQGRLLNGMHKKTGIMLPATCAGSTRNATAIFHPWLLQFIQHMEVSQDVAFEPHSPLCFTLHVQGDSGEQYNWNLPKSWAHLAPDRVFIADAYMPVDFDKITSDSASDNSTLVERACAEWSAAVERVVDKALGRAHSIDPDRCVVTSLRSSYKGRCKFGKVFRESPRYRVKSDRHGGYMPPSEVFTIRPRLKVRQVRRLKSLLRRLKSLELYLVGCSA